MTTALRNFLITFFVLILVFAFVGYRWIYPGLKGVVDEWFADDESSAPAEESGSSGDTSRVDDSSAPVPDTSGIVNENGDVFTAVVMSIDYKGSALICTFIDAEEIVLIQRSPVELSAGFFRNDIRCRTAVSVYTMHSHIRRHMLPHHVDAMEHELRRI